MRVKPYLLTGQAASQLRLSWARHKGRVAVLLGAAVAMVALLVAALVTTYLAVGIWWFARRRPDYRHMRHTISELGEYGARDARGVGLGLFAPVGLGLLALGLPALSAGLENLRGALGLLAVAVAVGYMGAALFPCDPGSPLAGSWRQQLHNLAGGVEYAGGAFALVQASAALTEAPAWLAPWLRVSAGVIVAVTVGLSLQAAFPIRGSVQRIGEAALFGNILLLAWLSRG